MPKSFYAKRDAEEDVKRKVTNQMKDKKTYPSTLQLDEGDLKEIKDWQVGKEYEIKLTVKCIGLSSKGEFAPPDDSDADKVHARFEVVEAECDEESKE